MGYVIGLLPLIAGVVAILITPWAATLFVRS
jgi:hypothetical protein